VRFEWIHKKFNGEPFWTEVILTKMVLNGEVVVHANWRDISEKKDLELKIAEQKETFETLFNESLDGLGLNVTYNIVTNVLGGTIECRREEGQGVEFLIGLHVKERA